MATILAGVPCQCVSLSGQDGDGIHVHIRVSASLHEADDMSASREDRAGVGGLPLQGWITGVDGGDQAAVHPYFE